MVDSWARELSQALSSLGPDANVISKGYRRDAIYWQPNLRFDKTLTG